MSRALAGGSRVVRGHASVVVAVVALVSVASMAASTVAPANARPASSSVADRAAVGPVGSAALGIVSELANTALSFGIDKGFGWVLGQFGLAEETSTPDPQLVEMEKQMTAIQARLAGIEDQLKQLELSSTQLRAELQQASFANLVSQATALVARVTKGMSELDYVAHMRTDDPDKKARTDDTLGYIKTYLMGAEQEELASRFSGSAGAIGLIPGAYNVEKSHTLFWVTRNSQSVRTVFSYYQDAEAQMLLLRVEYMHAHPKTYSGHYISTQIEKVRTTLLDQRNLRKIQTPAGVFADTRTGYEWNWQNMFTPYLPGRRPAIGALGVGFTYPYPSYFQALVKGHESDWVRWLDGELGGELPVPTTFSGVWLNGQFISGGRHWTNCVRPDGKSVEIDINSTQTCGALMVRFHQPTQYW